MTARQQTTQPSSPVWLHGFLGRQMRRYRELAGQSQVQMAKVVHVSAQHYFAFEKAVRVPTHDTVAGVDAALDARGALVEIRDEMTKSPHLGWFEKLCDMEQEATEIWQYQSQVVPGLLQTEGYARAVLEAAPRQVLTRTVDEDLAKRMARQSLITRDNAPPSSGASSTKRSCGAARPTARSQPISFATYWSWGSFPT